MHTCEKVDALAAKKRAMTPEQIRKEVVEKELRRQQQDEEAAALKQQTLASQTAGFAERRAKRKVWHANYPFG